MDEKFQTIIFLVRHGETDRTYLLDPTIDGERVLTQEGRDQIKKVGEYIANFAPVAIYSSPRLRTIQTAEVIEEVAKIPREIEQKQELYEIYSPGDYQALENIIPKFFDELITKHAGCHIVCTTHQDVIQGGLEAFDLTDEEKDFPCLEAEMYRLVFAGHKLVECQKLTPAASL
ncbi:MAG: histidine phosphatase family protein [Candidatus Berkelbacteria bacterium]|nr:MAG: histidine phosphatase family protein [Candidatus Berkelbacteria bacterium]QQG51428.1 MAG: histidine phosphatase family protein [Candidatus Berkelbacteria bacterium]